MSSMERAPEPTMEEILASIRRIISDDETNFARRGATYAPRQEEASLEVSDDEADTRIIDDIARVLSGGGRGEAEDDILDLTKEFGPLDEGRDEQPSTAPAEQGFISATIFQADIYSGVDPATSANAGSAPETTVGAEPEAGRDEATLSLEAAIAALRAGVVPAPEPEPDLVLSDLELEPVIEAEAPEPVVAVKAEQGFISATIFQADIYSGVDPATSANAGNVPETTVGAEPEAGRDEATLSLEAAIAALRAGVVPAPEPEPDLVLSDLELEPVIEAEAPEPVVAVKEESPFWSPSPSSWGLPSEPEPAPQRVNGGAHLESRNGSAELLAKSVEDTVKASLRPLLRQWLNEHMSTVLEAALRDELKGADENMSRMMAAALREELKDTEAQWGGN